MILSQATFLDYVKTSPESGYTNKICKRMSIALNTFSALFSNHMNARLNLVFPHLEKSLHNRPTVFL
jgi:hypothetical protein